MKILKSLPLILTLLTSEQALAQRSWNPFSSDKKTEVKQDKTGSKKTILHPANTKGKIKPRLDAWATGSYLAGSFSEVYGPFEMQLKATKGDKEVGAHIEYTSPEYVIGAFKKSNPQFKESNVRNFLNKYTLLDPKNPRYTEVIKLFNDGKLTEEEARKVGSLKDAIYYLPYLYRADNKEASLPGVLILHKYGDNFSYHELKDRKRKYQTPQTPANVPEVGLNKIDYKLNGKQDVNGVKENKPSSLEDRVGLRTRFGVESGVGTNGEKVIGAFVSIPLNKYISLEGYGDFYAGRGNPIVSSKTLEIIERERKLVNPGKYMLRTDEITTSLEDEAMLELGAGISFKADEFEFPSRIGLNFSEQEKRLYGKATIRFESNMEPIGDPEVITNTKYGGKSLATNLSLSQDALYNINKNLQSGVSYNRVGEKNSVRVNVRYKF